MDITDFLETTLDITDARKVLVIPNITNSQNIEKDSFVDVIYNHIVALAQYGNYFWHIILPKPVAKLNLENVKQHIVDISGDMIHMRVTFPRKAINLIQELDYDVVYSHLPDWFMVKRYTEKPIIGYAHWWEMKSCNAEDRKNRQRNIVPELLGVLGMEVCYLNTQDQKNRVLDEAREWFNNTKVQELDRILQVWHLGVPWNKIIDEPIIDKKKVIVFNHRAAAYKGYPQFIELMKEYRERRQDFSVWVPQLRESPEFDWIDNKRVNKAEYYERLQQCTVGIQMRQSNYGWSLAATDCMMNGTPVIFQESDCYREIDPGGLFFKYKKDFFTLLDKFLDDRQFGYTHSVRSIERSKELHFSEQEMIKSLHNNMA
jgi:glycosyltransferase involved in cell wall biosynthesis